ncbi:L-dopachrome tautomerase-related protein [Roseibacillus persicicus]|uniref:L-dopachrome tautomerase-related protein n=1 Tax=Roseibacillus persicicus TaxID=454148 RepID=UPI00281060E1|nr:L-dopachrome tautomerase-related protein [Roseibacillus persicicus]MDQ8191882.1 L-dopachrome tautomerase-related protein [Roseibacillus persicicus]
MPTKNSLFLAAAVFLGPLCPLPAQSDFPPELSTLSSAGTQHASKADLKEEDFGPLIKRRFVHGKESMLAFWTMKKGGLVPWHNHVSEQITHVISGEMIFTLGVDEKEFHLKAGDSLVIPANVPHKALALEDTYEVDVFAPIRKDWLDGSANYLQAAPETKKQSETPKADAKSFNPKAEVFAEVEGAVGNITNTAKGDLVYSLHPFFNPEMRVMKYDAQSQTSSPFPNQAWVTPRDSDDHFLCNVLGLRNDANGIVWMLDMGQRNPVTPKIVGWNTHTDELERIYYLPTTALSNHAQPNDMLVDTKNEVFVIADEGIGNGGDGSTAALIVVDMKTGVTRRLLEGHRTTRPQNIPTVINGKTLTVGGKPLLVGCDGITADAESKWLYYCPLNGDKIYRVLMSDLLNPSLSENELDSRIETYSDKPNNGGLSIDSAGNLYLTSMGSNSVTVILAKDRSVHTLFQDENLVWPDGVNFNEVDGHMYVSAAQVNLGAPFNNGISAAKQPFRIYRFRPLAIGVPHR